MNHAYMGDSGIDRRGHRGSCLQAHQQVTQGGLYDWKSVNYGRAADPYNRQGLNKKQEEHYVKDKTSSDKTRKRCYI